MYFNSDIYFSWFLFTLIFEIKCIIYFIRSLHDVKATEVGGEVRFKAEVDFDGLEITRAYLLKVDLENLLTVSRQLFINNW